jgi:transcriptional regulator with XRE-family HTH domain
MSVLAAPRFSCTRLRDARERRGLSREQAAVDIGRSYASIVAYETGRCVPSVESLARLAGAFSCDPGEFFEVAA